MTKKKTGIIRAKDIPPGPRGRISGYCWAEHPNTHVHCTEPAGHHGTHWHPYSKTSW